MQFIRSAVKRLGVTGLTLVVVLAVAGTAGAVSVINGNQIKARSIHSRSISLNAINSRKIQNRAVNPGDLSGRTYKKLSKIGSPGPQGPQGPQGPAGPAGSGTAGSATYSGAHWGQIDRNTLGSPTVALRPGPYEGAAVPPFGVGSLGLTVNGTPRAATTNDAEQATFGNEVDFNGNLVSNLTALGFQVFTTGENNGIANPNMPAIKIEIDPNLTATPSNFSTLTFTPQNSPANQWSGYIDATTAPASPSGYGFTLSGAAGTATGCNLASPCTFTQVKAALANGTGATIFTIGVGKGRDFSWSGAIDGLRVNGTTFNFEPFGVTSVATP